MESREQLEAKVRQLAVLCEVTRSVTELVDLERLIPFVIGKVKALLPADGCALLLLDGEKQELYFPYTAEAVPEVDRRLGEIRFPVTHGIAGWVVRHGRPDVVGDAADDARWNPEVDRQTGVVTRSLLTAPLRGKHGVIGAIQARSTRVNAFAPDDLHFLVGLADGVAVAIENAQLYHQLKESEQRLRNRVAALQRDAARASRFKEIVGSSDAMQRVWRLMASAITTPITVLLYGETGTGKELIARAIHYNGPRQDQLFVPVNCGALSEQLLESELFGYRKGAFTGAIEDRKGFLDTANGGTIFLDEIGEMSMAMQVKLLRVVESGEVLPVGERTPHWVDVRIISASNRDLQQEVQRGHFREDLYYRLNKFPITVPPLRERRGDIPLLVTHFLREISQQFERPVAGVSRDAMEALTRYAWPGNVRELRNELERAVALTAAGDTVSLDHFSPHISASAETAIPDGCGTPAAPSSAAAPPATPLRAPSDAPVAALRDARATFEKRYIIDALRRHNGNVSKAAKMLGLSRSMLHKKMRDYGID